MALKPSEVVIRRLRGLGRIPPGTGVVMCRAGRSRAVPSGTKVLWQLTDAVTGAEIGIRSRFTAGDLAAAREWCFAREGDVTYVAPG